MEKAILYLKDGKQFEGRAIGKIGTTFGEICFNTGLTGYQEIFTDPSYYGQVVTMTFPHIGNYGVNESEIESDSVKISGLICRDFSKRYSRVNATGSLQDYLDKNNIVGIEGIDTRELVRYIRTKGAMNCVISSEIMDSAQLKEILDKQPAMAGLELSSKVSTSKAFVFEAVANPNYKVAAIDFGIKTNILRNFSKRGIETKVFPMSVTLDELKAYNADGYFLSNGPGDPSAMVSSIDLVKHILSLNKPVFGICLGHQLLSLALGLSTYKMHNGHRGLNHPVKNLLTGKSEVTSQNHGFSVSAESLKNNSDVEVTHINLNDNTIEGIRLKNKNVFSIQYHPESSPGPHDSEYLFDDFLNMLKL